jgi:hypothetical protein
MCLAVAPARAATGPAYFGFESQAVGTPPANLYPGSGVTFSWSELTPECLGTAAVRAASDAMTPPNLFRLPCSSIVTIRFSSDAVFVAIWVRSRSGVPSPIAIRAFDANGSLLTQRDLAATSAWQPATVTQNTATIASVTVSASGPWDFDDLAVATQGPQPDGALTQSPPPVTRQTSATFGFVGNWSGTWFQCSLDGAAYSQCSSTSSGTVGYSGLAGGTHTFRARTIDWYTNIDPTPIEYVWLIDLTPPETRIDDGPPVTTTRTDATVRFSSPDADTASYSCSLDGAAPASCTSPWNTSGLAPGQHRLEVVAIDGVGNADVTPAARPWTVLADRDRDGVPDATDNCPDAANHDQADADSDGLGDICDVPPLTDRDRDTVPDGSDNCPDQWNPDQADADRDGIGDACDVPPNLDTDADGVPNVRDNCPTVANSDQADGDRDAVGDACDSLPPGNVAPVANVNAVAQAVAGEVLVQVPGQTGFQPLAGVASLPVGTTVDARKGRLTLTTATTSRRRGARGRATLAAAIFTIRQRRVRDAKRKARIATRILLRTPPGLARACAGTGARPLKGVVRTLVGTANGLYETVGGASTTTVRSATYTVEDTCQGTRTSVGRGRVTVRGQSLRRDVTVRAGQQFLVKARLFAARKGRGD